MSDFLFHKVAEKEKQEIKKQVKGIIEDFSKKLSKINTKTKDASIERETGERPESKTKSCDTEFKKVMFENALNKNKDFIIAEKKQW